MTQPQQRSSQATPIAMRDMVCHFRSRRFAPWRSAASTASRASQSSTSIWRGGMFCAASSPAARSPTWAATAPISTPTELRLPWLQQIDSISGNGRHAIVIAPELVRIEMLRIGHTYELAITRLWLKSEEGHTRPAIATAPDLPWPSGNACRRTLECGEQVPARNGCAGLLYRGRRGARPAGALRRGDSQDHRRSRLPGMQAHAHRRGSGPEQRR